MRSSILFVIVGIVGACAELSDVLDVSYATFDAALDARPVLVVLVHGMPRFVDIFR